MSYRLEKGKGVEVYKLRYGIVLEGFLYKEFKLFIILCYKCFFWFVLKIGCCTIWWGK